MQASFGFASASSADLISDLRDKNLLNAEIAEPQSAPRKTFAHCDDVLAWSTMTFLETSNNA